MGAPAASRTRWMEETQCDFWMCASKCPSAGAIHTRVCCWPENWGVFTHMGFECGTPCRRKKARQPGWPLGTSTSDHPLPGLAPQLCTQITSHTPILRVHTANHMERTPATHTQSHIPDTDPGRHTQIHSDINKERQCGHSQGRRLVFHTKTQPSASAPHGDPSMTRTPQIQLPIRHAAMPDPGTDQDGLMWLGDCGHTSFGHLVMWPSGTSFLTKTPTTVISDSRGTLDPGGTPPPHCLKQTYTQSRHLLRWGTFLLGMSRGHRGSWVLGSHSASTPLSLPHLHVPGLGPVPSLSLAWLFPTDAGERNKA